MRDKLAEVVTGTAVTQRRTFGATTSLGQGGCGGMENEKRQPKGDCRRLLQAAAGGYMRV